MISPGTTTATTTAAHTDAGLRCSMPALQAHAVPSPAATFDTGFRLSFSEGNQGFDDGGCHRVVTRLVGVESPRSTNAHEVAQSRLCTLIAADADMLRPLVPMSLVLAVCGCGVPDIRFYDDDGGMQAEAGFDSGLDVQTEDAADDSSSDDSSSGDAGDAPPGDALPDAPTDGGSGSCPDTVPDGATTCCGAIECIGNCSSCAQCLSKCSATQECCVRGQSVTCHTPGSMCP